MPRMDILSTVEREEFDAPPVFTRAQQLHYFDPPLKIIRTIKRLKTPTNQVYFLLSYGYFLLSYGYFQATSRFYAFQQFHKLDIQYVTHLLGWSTKQLHPASYAPETQSRHRSLILKLCQFRVWKRAVRQMLQTEALSLAQLYREPRQIFELLSRVVSGLLITRRRVRLLFLPCHR